MGLRSELLVELVKEVLGPRNGPHEVMEASPLDEYLTGVLQPAGLQAPEPGSEAESLMAEMESGEEDLEGPEIAPILFTPAMDPRARPSSMGLSFRVRVAGRDSPALDIAVSWARYEPVDPGENRSSRPPWCRRPRCRVLESPGEGIHHLGADGPAPPDEAELSLHLQMERDPEEPDVFQVRIHLVNRIRPRDPQRARVEEHIFQPQIRVVCGEGTRLEAARPIPGWTDPEERRLAFLYRDRPVMARGHLVSAVWREIDPERPAPPDREAERPDGPPFVWVDGGLLDESARRRFSPPDVRTEFVPVYALRAPDWSWDSRYGPEPVLDADRLAELGANPEALRQALEPLIRGYEAWIREQREEASGLPPEERAVAEELLRECQDVLDRMRAGLDLLVRDPDVRLAFAFSQKAMALQAEWGGRGPALRWRPFQLAFLLMNLRAIACPDHPDRRICDLLWVPTGAGKTEAYLALAAFTMALRRRRALQRDRGDRTGAGVTVLSRYTLRLLTIQQFRRALAMVTACELLRVRGLREGRPVGWRPPGWQDRQDFLWGSVPFRIGLWVGGNLTPNRLQSLPGSPGALDLLRGQRGEGEPAQILKCPACGAWLAIPEEEGLPAGEHELHLVIRRPEGRNPLARIPRELERAAPPEGVRISMRGYPHSLPGGAWQILTLHIRTDRPLRARELDEWWREGPGRVLTLAAFRPSRPGYFPVRVRKVRTPSQYQEVDFEIWCPAPACPLAEEWWCEGVPGDLSGLERRGGTVRPGSRPRRDRLHHPWRREPLVLPDGMVFRTIPEPWPVAGEEDPDDATRFLACRVPIPALPVDEQVYRRLPAMVVATVDKFARLPFLEEAGALFGNVRGYRVPTGYVRDLSAQTVPVEPPDPPDLILQDELHLVEGPLGSLAGLYETAIDFLSRNGESPVKYVAATATIRAAEAQVASLFHRPLRIFPPPGLRAGDRFFARNLEEPHPLEEAGAGQLYAGLLAPGRGSLTPVYRIWACLLQQVWRRRNHPDSDFFWTLVGYFNAIRELAGALALYRQDIPQRIRDVFPDDPRPLNPDPEELSSRIPSTRLPALLDRLGTSGQEAPDALLATSMFGTGVDVPRLSLMVVHGQPKTTAAYIQATGRVGRRHGALVVVFLRASRPRDLSHYEFFCGYHRQLHRHVEPVTVMPFSPGAMDLALGPVMVAILRHRRDSDHSWHPEGAAPAMAERRGAPEVRDLPGILKERARHQPPGRAPDPDRVEALAKSGLDRWAMVARQHGNRLVYVEYAIGRPPGRPVVLGDPAHQRAGLPAVFENAPQSMREVEETIDFAI